MCVLRAASSSFFYCLVNLASFFSRFAPRPLRPCWPLAPFSPIPPHPPMQRSTQPPFILLFPHSDATFGFRFFISRLAPPAPLLRGPNLPRKHTRFPPVQRSNLSSSLSLLLPIRSLSFSSSSPSLLLACLVLRLWILCHPRGDQTDNVQSVRAPAYSPGQPPSLLQIKHHQRAAALPLPSHRSYV